MNSLNHVHVLESPGLYGLVSHRSRRTYYIDTRHAFPRVLRTPAGYDEGFDPDDDAWRALILLESMPVNKAPDGRRLRHDEMEATDRLRWALRVGRRHLFTWYRPSQPYDVETLGAIPPMPPLSAAAAYDMQDLLDRIDVVDQLPADVESGRLTHAERMRSEGDE